MAIPSISDVQIEKIIEQLERGKQIRKRLPLKGKIRIERKLPFLLLYRYSGNTDKNTVKLVLGEVSYLITQGEEDFNGSIAKLIMKIAGKFSKEFGSFIVMELWTGEEGSRDFKIKCAKDKAPATIEMLEKGLAELGGKLPDIRVTVETTKQRQPNNLAPILTLEQCQEAGCFLIGLEVPPIYRSDVLGDFYPIIFRILKRGLSQVLRQSFYEFIRVQTSCDISSYHMLGSRSIEPAVWHVDKKMAEIEDTYRFLLLISPINTNEARHQFQKDHFQKNPEFIYRILPVDPDYLKETLYKINIRKINDPTFAYLFRDKREELEKQITMLRERGTKDFLYSSIRLYKAIDKELLKLAKEILTTVPDIHPAEEVWVDCHYLAEKAREEISWYRQQYPQLDATVEIKPDVIGIMVSKGQLIIGESYKTPEKRVNALIQHEVGTHVLTYFNGKAQPLKQLYSGLAGYDELQEGIAVLSEYLVDGLTSSRLRLLAARVVAAHTMTEGGDFVETFRELKDHYEFDLETAFDITSRIHQGGGCTKDIIYLRGLVELLDHLKNGGDLESLFVGKIAAKHIPIMEELKERQVLNQVPLRPRFLQDETTLKRLKKVKQGILLTELIKN